MATSSFYGYSSSALVFNPGNGTFMLDPQYDYRTDRVLFEVTDDDAFLDGDRGRNEVGEDTNQTGVVTASDGTPIGSGLIYGEQFAVLRAPDGSYVTIDRVEIDGVGMGYVPSEPLQPGVSYTYVGSRNIDDQLDGAGGNDTRLSYAAYEQNSVPCFGPGTMVKTKHGEIPVEWLDSSDFILTRDHGFQPIQWIGRTKIAPSHFKQYPSACPVRIPAGALGPDCPSHDLFLTGDHRVMIRSARAELLYFSPEVLAPAKSWIDAGIASIIVPSRPYTLTHILCASHEVILAQGTWVESLFTGAETLRRLGPEVTSVLEQKLGDTLHTMQAARPCLSRREAALLLEQDQQPKRSSRPLKKAVGA